MLHNNAALFKEVDDILQKSQSCVLLWKDLKVLLAYFTAIIVWQRSGCVQNMTLREFQNVAETDHGKFIIRVIDHKTADSFGPASIVLDKPGVQGFQREC